MMVRYSDGCDGTGHWWIRWHGAGIDTMVRGKVIRVAWLTWVWVGEMGGGAEPEGSLCG